jgi:acetyl-CoA C-acetyltransferase
MSTHTPVLVGVAQVLQRTDDFTQAREPLELMIEAVQNAAADAGSTVLLERAGSVRVVRGLWRYGDPGRAIAESIGVPTAETAITTMGGNGVQHLVNRTCLDIQSGKQDVVVIAGAECGRSFMRARKAGSEVKWSDVPGKADIVIGENLSMAHEIEVARGIGAANQVYSMFENGLRYERSWSIEEHRRNISELWAGFSEVAANNPNAWIQERKTAEEIGTPGPGNRAVTFPYPMLMNSNSRVDMGAALILTSEATALACGVPREKLVYPHAGTDVHDHTWLSERERLHASPGMRIAGGRCLELAGLSPSELDHREVYSCFPSAVQVAAKEIGLDPKGTLTVTGGNTFGGGPMNNVVMHSIARMAEVLRDDAGAKGLVTANGGFLTKHAFGVYSTEPPERPFQYANPQDEVDALPKCVAVLDAIGGASIETYTVMYENNEPSKGYVACLLPDGRRTWGTVSDPDVVDAMTREEFCGRSGRLASGGVFELGN